MAARSRARYLAPIALTATIAGTYVIVHHGLNSTTPASHHLRPAAAAPRGRYARSKFYVIQGGDSLTSIAVKTGVALTTLESLNPTIDPNSLQTGYRLRLRR